MQIDPLRRIASRDRGWGGRNVEKLPLFPNSLQFVAKKLRFNKSAAGECQTAGQQCTPKLSIPAKLVS